MLITARQDETNWRCFFEGPIEISLDGRVLDLVRACDDEEGWADVYRVEDGKVAWEWTAGRPEDIVVRLYGKVEIIGTRRPS